MSTKQYFSTSALSTEEQRLSAWQDVMWRVSGRVKLETVPDEPFMAELEYGSVGQATLCRLTAGPHRAVHVVDPATGGKPDLVKLLFVLEGGLRLDHGGRTMELREGDWTVCGTGRTYRLTVDRSVKQLLMAVPRQLLCSHQRDIVRLGNRLLSASAGSGKVVREVVASLLDELETLKPETAADLIAMTLELAHMAVQDSVRAEGASSVREMLHERMSGFIRRNLRDPDLSVDRVAAAFACSKRYVHKIFNGERQSVRELILASRLENCCRDLADANLADQSITGIAFGWGFSNSAHFSRVFRERYGLTPSEYRARETRHALSAAG
jgi:AraC-like DNA-binding protein